MTIASLNDYIASAKQRVPWNKTGALTTVASSWFSAFAIAGDPGAGTLAGTSTAAGVVPTDTTAGYPALTAFGGGAAGYLTKVEYGSTVACRIAVFDRLFVAGAYTFSASTTLSSPPSYSGRLPANQSNGQGIEIWVEQVTAATGNQAVNVTYTNQGGATGQTTGAVGIGAAPTVGRCWQLPLAAGDSGVEGITGVVGTVASVGTFNVMALRRLFSCRVQVANGGDVVDLLRTGQPQLFATSALYVLVSPDSTALGIPDLNLEVANN